MPNREFQYDIALSFAEEDHELVDCVAKKLHEKGINYYYYKEKQVASWGQQLNKFLDDIYRRQSRFCVVFLSKHYKVKTWTRFEMKKARRRAVNNINEYILPYLIDDSPVPVVFSKVNYLSREQYDCDRLADAIFEKVQHGKTHYKPVSTFRQLIHTLSRPINTAALTLSLVGALTLGFFDQLTPVDSLAKRLYERSVVHRCAICKDGWVSFSHGRGTCSHHHGVDHYVEDTILHTKTMEQCLEEANGISLFHK